MVSYKTSRFIFTFNLILKIKTKTLRRQHCSKIFVS